MGILVRAVVVVAIMVAVVACGTTGYAPGSSHGSAPAASTTASQIPDIAVSPPSGAKEVTFQAETFPNVSDPCRMPSTVPFSEAPKTCEYEWSSASTTYVPGADAMHMVQAPSVVYADAGVSTSTAATVADAYIRQLELSFWAMKYDDIAMLSTLSGQLAQENQIFQALKNGAVVHAMPACVGPSNLQVVSVSKAAQTYLQSQGWAYASTEGLVITNPPCSGLVLLEPGGQLVVAGKAATSSSYLLTGSVENVAPYGLIWVMNGESGCGVPALRNTCTGG